MLDDLGNILQILEILCIYRAEFYNFITNLQTLEEEEHSCIKVSPIPNAIVIILRTIFFPKQNIWMVIDIEM